MRNLQFAIAIALSLAGAACGSDSSGDAKTCTPGESRACTGPAGCAGGQVCKSDGAGYLPCDCGVGGTSGAAGAAGAAGQSGASGVCPTGLPGPELVEVPALDSTRYCIDSTEVTFAQYDEFLAAGLSSGQLEGYCKNAAFQLWATCMAQVVNSTPDAPVVCVNWCAAREYCKWAGKRLCGKIGGGSNLVTPEGVPPDENSSQWENACSAGGTRDVAYPTEAVSQCAGPTPMQPSEVVTVKSRPACVGGFPGLYEMSSNVWEWEDACFDPAVGDGCLYRPNGLCATTAPPTPTEHATLPSPVRGFRCCHDGAASN